MVVHFCFPALGYVHRSDLPCWWVVLASACCLSSAHSLFDHAQELRLDNFCFADAVVVEQIDERSSMAVILMAIVLFLAFLETLLARWFTRGGLRSSRSAGLTGANADSEQDRFGRGAAA